jgi:hypothetical protein
MTDTKTPTTLEQMIANTCFCKLKEFCPDKNSAECMSHKNIYDEFMQQKRPLKLG